MKQESPSTQFTPDELEATLCPVCASTGAFLLYDFHPFKVMRCGTCRSGYLSPRLKKDRMARLYREDYFAREDSPSRGYEDYHTLAPLLQKTVRRRYRWIRPFVRGGSLLDVGCAHGYALDALQKDFDRCCGVDLSPEAVAEVTRKGHEAHCGDLFSAPWKAATFDLVLCFDTLEHIYEPVAFMHKVAELLRPGGVVAIATPNLDGWLSRFSGKRWVSLKIPEHVLFLTRPSMKRLLEEAGLSIRSIRGDLQCAPLSLVLDRLGRSLPGPGRLLCGLAGLRAVSRAKVTVPNGMLLAIARKQGEPHGARQTEPRSMSASSGRL